MPITSYRTVGDRSGGCHSFHVGGMTITIRGILCLADFTAVHRILELHEHDDARYPLDLLTFFGFTYSCV